MTLVAGLYKQYKPADRRSRQQSNVEMDQAFARIGLNEKEAERKRKEKEEREAAKEAAKRKAREDKERAKQSKNKPKRAPFDFEKVCTSMLDHLPILTAWKRSTPSFRRNHKFSPR